MFPIYSRHHFQFHCVCLCENRQLPIPCGMIVIFPNSRVDFLGYARYAPLILGNFPGAEEFHGGNCGRAFRRAGHRGYGGLPKDHQRPSSNEDPERPDVGSGCRSETGIQLEVGPQHELQSHVLYMWRTCTTLLAQAQTLTL